MGLDEAIKQRRSVRKFLGKDVSDAALKKIIDAANHAPTACDIQGYRFVIINDKKVKQRIVDNGAASFIMGAPAGVLVLYDNRTKNIEYNDDVQSGAAAIQNMLLMAYSLGIGSCWICHLPTKRQLRKILRIPHNYDPLAYIALGYPLKKIKERPRRHKTEELMSYNKFSFKERIPSRINIGLWLNRLGRRIYYKLPMRKHIKPTVDRLFEKKFE